MSAKQAEYILKRAILAKLTPRIRAELATLHHDDCQTFNPVMPPPLSPAPQTTSNQRNLAMINFTHEPSSDRPPARSVFRPAMDFIIKEGFEFALHLTAVGQKVQARLDDGTIIQTRLTKLPWQLGHGQWVVGLTEHHSFDCRRVTPFMEPA